MEKQLLKKIRYITVFFMIALALSGITAFPVYSELRFIIESGFFTNDSFFGAWLRRVYEAVAVTQQKFPFLFYGYDWLAFAHLMIAAVFYGVYKNPVRNIFIINWGMFCCVAIIPLAFICGPIRGIPFTHIIIDCCFGIFGIIPLLVCKKWVLQLQSLQQKNG